MTKTSAFMSTAGLLALFWLTSSPLEPGSGEAIVSVTVPVLGGEAAEGEKLFNTNCSVCHGTNAAGNDGAGPPLVHRIYEPGHHGDGSFQRAVLQGVGSHHWRFGDMPPVEGINPNEVSKIAMAVIFRFGLLIDLSRNCSSLLFRPRN